MTVYRSIVELLEDAGCRFETMSHEIATTAAEAASVRGMPLEAGTKAILFKFGTEFGIFAMRADLEIHSAKIRRGLGIKRTRFAFREELAEKTGLKPGSVPPFGEPVLPFPLFVDPSVVEREEMVFTAGSRKRSIRLSVEDYRRVADPTVLPLARTPRG